MHPCTALCNYTPTLHSLKQLYSITSLVGHREIFSHLAQPHQSASQPVSQQIKQPASQSAIQQNSCYLIMIYRCSIIFTNFQNNFYAMMCQNQTATFYRMAKCSTLFILMFFLPHPFASSASQKILSSNYFVYYCN